MDVVWTGDLSRQYHVLEITLRTYNEWMDIDPEFSHGFNGWNNVEVAAKETLSSLHFPKHVLKCTLFSRLAHCHAFILDSMWTIYHHIHRSKWAASSTLKPPPPYPAKKKGVWCNLNSGTSTHALKQMKATQWMGRSVLVTGESNQRRRNRRYACTWQ